MSRWKRRFIRQLHVFTKEIGFCELFLYVCRLNPREALEHYRTSVKDQREQEQRRHEHQVQELQVALRQANEALTAKNHD
ncbi:hypothetical protein XEUV181_19630, partial [Xanthomonas euvesicatoria]